MSGRKTAASAVDPVLQSPDGAHSASQTNKKRVLVVSEDAELLIELWTRISSIRGGYSVQIADTSDIALNALRVYPIDIAVVDLAMPSLGGLRLLVRIAESQPETAIVVLTTDVGENAEQVLRRLGSPVFARHRRNVGDICAAVRSAAGAAPAPVPAVGPGVLAALAEVERATCTISVDDAATGGTLFLANGELVDAEAGSAKGEGAAVALLHPDIGRATIDALKQPRGVERTVRAPLEELVDRVTADRSSPAARPAEPGTPTRPARASHPPEAGSAPAAGPEHVSDSRDTVVADRAAGGGPERVRSGIGFIQEKDMALEKHLQQLKEIKGYKASGIMHYTGEMLASDSSDPNINLEMVGATFNDIFRSAHEASKKIGLDACRETVIITPKGVIVMACSGVDSKAHVHLLGVVSSDGNHSLMKMHFGKMLPDVVGELS